MLRFVSLWRHRNGTWAVWNAVERRSCASKKKHWLRLVKANLLSPLCIAIARCKFIAQSKLNQPVWRCLYSIIMHALPAKWQLHAAASSYFGNLMCTALPLGQLNRQLNMKHRSGIKSVVATLFSCRWSWSCFDEIDFDLINSITLS